jgi:hypothetical protein
VRRLLRENPELLKRGCTEQKCLLKIGELLSIVGAEEGLGDGGLLNPIDMFFPVGRAGKGLAIFRKAATEGEEQLAKEAAPVAKSLLKEAWDWGVGLFTKSETKVAQESVEQVEQTIVRETAEQAEKEVVKGTSEIVKKMPEIDANKLHHVFDNPAHKLDSLVAKYGGDRSATMTAIWETTQKEMTRRGVTGVFEETVNVGGTMVTVRGRVVDGIVRIGTAFSK